MEDVLCNKCGKSCKIGIGWGITNINAVNIRHTFCYGSKFDMTTFDFDLCEDCFIELAKSLQIEPIIVDYYAPLKEEGR